MLLAFTLLLASVPEGAATHETCQSLQADLEAARRTALAAGPVATVRASQPFCTGWDVVTIYRLVDGGGPDEAPSQHWALRHDEERSGGGVTITWADSRSCPTIAPALEGLSRLSLSMRLDGLRPGDGLSFPIPVTDGTWFVIDAYMARQSDNRVVSISVSSNDGAIADWGRDLLDHMTPCWGKKKPQMPG